MPRLLLMRHAKSSWSQPGFPDHERPLNARGQKSAILMAEAILARDLRPSGVLCSTALRTRTTLFPLLERMEGEVGLCFSRKVYEAGGADYPALIKGYGDKLASRDGTLLILGHNFAIQEAALALIQTRAAPENAALKAKFPTGAVAVLHWEGGFAECAPQCAELAAFLRPRLLEESG